MEQKKLEVNNPRYGLIYLKDGIKNHCSYYDPIGDYCCVVECLQCENTEYKITFDTGVVLKTDNFDEYDFKPNEKFVIVFPHMVSGDIFEYLISDENDYGIIRLQDNVIMRYTRDEYYKEYGEYPESSSREKNYENKKRLHLVKARDNEMGILNETIKLLEAEGRFTVVKSNKKNGDESIQHNYSEDKPMCFFKKNKKRFKSNQ